MSIPIHTTLNAGRARPPFNHADRVDELKYEGEEIVRVRSRGDEHGRR